MKAGSKGFRWPQGRRAAVSLSFDDARLSQADVGIPILDRHGIKGTFYVLPGNLRRRLRGWRAAVARGHEIGNHTVNHPCMGNFAWVRPENALEGYTLARMEAELLRANIELRKALDVRPTSFAYCCCQTFVGAGVQVRSYVPLVAKHFVVGRSGVGDVHNRPGHLDLAQVWSSAIDNKTFAQVWALVEAAVADRGWLILVGHEVGRAGGTLTTTASVLRRVCARLAARREIWTDTVSAIGQHIRAQAGP